MESIRINVLESYDPKFCCVCVQNGDDSYLNVFENVISYQNVFISLAQIINDTLGLHVRKLLINIQHYDNILTILGSKKQQPA